MLPACVFLCVNACVPVYCICPVPEPAPTKPSPGPSHHLHPASPTLSLSSSSSGNGKRASSSSQLATQTPPQQQCQLSSASARYPPREVPPRFRQQEHKQLLKRGQPLPAGALSALTVSSSSSSSSSPSSPYSSSSTSTSSTTPNSATSTADKQHQGLCQCSKHFFFCFGSCCVHCQNYRTYYLFYGFLSFRLYLTVLLCCIYMYSFIYISNCIQHIMYVDLISTLSFRCISHSAIQFALANIQFYTKH